MKIISPHPLFNPSTTNKKLVTTRSQQHKNHRRKKSSIDSMLKQEGISDIIMDQVSASNHTRVLQTIEMVYSSSFQENDLPQEVTAADETDAGGSTAKEEVERHADACTSNGKKKNRKHLRKKKQESQTVSNDTKRVSMILEDPPAPHKDHDTHNSNHGHWTSLEKFNVNRFDLLLNGKESTSTTSATSNDMGSNVTEIRSGMCNKCTEDCNLYNSRPLSTLHGAGKKSNVLHGGTNQGLGIPSTTTNVASSTTRETADHHDAKNPIEMECHFPLSNESKSNAFTQLSIHDDCVHSYSYYNFDDCSTHDEHNYYDPVLLSKNSSEQEQEDVYPTPWWWMEYPFVSNYDHLEPYQQDYHGMYYTEYFIPTIAGTTMAESTTSCNIVGYEEVNIGGCVYFHPIFE